MFELIKTDKLLIKTCDHFININNFNETIGIDYHISQKIRYYKSILCGALVYIAIFLFNRLNTNFGKVIGIIVPISFFVYAGFQHCIANMFYIAAGGVWNLNAFIGLLICILGNSIGALLLDLFVKYE